MLTLFWLVLCVAFLFVGIVIGALWGASERDNQPW